MLCDLTDSSFYFAMDSLHPPCTALKKAYDSCFNHWFDEYLQLAAPIPPSAGKGNPKVEEERQAKIKAKAIEYEQKCGATWKAYRDCLEVHGLESFSYVSSG